jgi:hypothetical protein
VAAEYEESTGRNPLDYVLAEIGGNTGRGLSGADTKDADQLGGIAIELIDADLRPYSSFAFVAICRTRCAPSAGRNAQLPRLALGPGGDALDVQIYGADAETLKAAAEALKTALALPRGVGGRGQPGL